MEGSTRSVPLRIRIRASASTQLRLFEVALAWFFREIETRRVSFEVALFHHELRSGPVFWG